MSLPLDWEMLVRIKSVADLRGGGGVRNIYFYVEESEEQNAFKQPPPALLRL